MKKLFAIFTAIFATQIAQAADWCENTFTKQFAKITWSGLGITNGKGKVGHTTLSHNHNGAYMKRTGLPINRRTAAQVAVRNGFATISQEWGALTEAVRSAFRSNTSTFPKKDSLAQTQTLTGAQLYMRLNRNLQAINVAIITAFPALRSIANYTTASIAAAAGAATMALTYTPIIPATDSWILQASGPVSAGKNSGKQNFKQIGVYLAANVSPLNIKADYELIYGTSWKTAGKKIFFRIKAVGSTEGYESAIKEFTTIVAA